MKKRLGILLFAFALLFNIMANEEQGTMIERKSPYDTPIKRSKSAVEADIELDRASKRGYETGTVEGFAKETGRDPKEYEQQLYMQAIAESEMREKKKQQEAENAYYDNYYNELAKDKSQEHTAIIVIVILGIFFAIILGIVYMKKEVDKDIKKDDKEIRTNEKSETILTEKEKETSNKYREELSLYRDMLIFDKTINVEHLKAMYPTINESTLQQLKDGSKITQEEKLAGFPYLIYCHACDRLEITPFNQDNVFASVDNDDNMISSLKKAVEHSNAIGTLKNAITGCLDNLIKLTDNEKEFDILFCGLIDIVADLLVKNRA